MFNELIIENNEITSNIIDDLANIDLTTDAVIIYKSSKMNIKEVEFNVDSFDVKTIEELKPKSINNKTVFYIYTRIKLLLPLGLFPDFKIAIDGLKIRTEMINKIQGIQLDQQLSFGDKILNISGMEGYYSIYDKIHFELEHYDRQQFNSNKFIGLRIPINTNILNFRLIPHFAGNWPNINNVYAIHSSYIYDRIPNF